MVLDAAEWYWFVESFVAGIVLHTGPRTYCLVDRLIAAPISTLWA